MKSIEQWFAEYSESHTHPLNVAIHKVAVPAVVFSLLAMLWPIKLPVLGVNLAVLAVGAALVFYSCLSLVLCLGMAIEAGLMLAYLAQLAQLESGWPVTLWQLGAGIFVVAWILQFVGHKIEGKKPSFFQDLVFLMIGPLWTLNFLYRRFGIKV